MVTKVKRASKRATKLLKVVGCHGAGGVSRQKVRLQLSRGGARFCLPHQQSECIFHRGVFVCLATCVFAYFMRAGLVCGKRYLLSICYAFVNAWPRQDVAESSWTWRLPSKRMCSKTHWRKSTLFFCWKRWVERCKHLMLWEGKEACLLFPMSLELSVEEAAMILWCQNYGRAQRDSSEKTHDWVRRTPDVVMSVVLSLRRVRPWINLRICLILNCSGAQFKGMDYFSQNCLLFCLGFIIQNMKRNTLQGTNECWHCV